MRVITFVVFCLIALAAAERRPRGQPGLSHLDRRRDVAQVRLAISGHLRVSRARRAAGVEGQPPRCAGRPLDTAGGEVGGRVVQRRRVRSLRPQANGPMSRSVSSRRPAIELEFSGAEQVEFVEIARYYDARKAAYSLSLDNWGFRAERESRSAVARRRQRPVRQISSGPGGLPSQRLARLDRHQHARRRRRAVLADAAGRTRSGRSKLGARGPCRDPSLQRRGLHGPRLPQRDPRLPRPAARPVAEDSLGPAHFRAHLDLRLLDDSVLATSAGQFVLVRGYNGHDNPTSVDYAAWNPEHGFYGVGGLSYKAYDAVFQSRQPAGRYYRADVEALDAAFERVCGQGQIFYAMWVSGPSAPSRGGTGVVGAGSVVGVVGSRSSGV